MKCGLDAKPSSSHLYTNDKLGMPIIHLGVVGLVMFEGPFVKGSHELR